MEHFNPDDSLGVVSVNNHFLAPISCPLAVVVNFGDHVIFLVVEFAVSILNNPLGTTMLFFTAGSRVILANLGLRTKAIFEIIIRNRLEIPFI